MVFFFIACCTTGNSLTRCSTCCNTIARTFKMLYSGRRLPLIRSCRHYFQIAALPDLRSTGRGAAWVERLADLSWTCDCTSRQRFTRSPRRRARAAEAELTRYVPCAPMLIGQHETSIERTRCQCVCRVPATSNLAAILRCPAETRLRRNWTPGDSLHACLLRIVKVNSTLLETCDCSRAVAITAAVAEFARMQIN